MRARGVLWIVVALLLCVCGADRLDEGGLVVGHVDHARAVIGWHAPTPGRYTLAVAPTEDDGPTTHASADARALEDLAVSWRIEGLQPRTRYTLTLRDAGDTIRARGSLRTAPAPGAPARVRLVLGSCASSTDHPIWDRIFSQEPAALVLLGDTPYIDTVKPAALRAAHRRFLQMPSLARLVRTIPLWSTWDDHDYGADNADGSLLGKEDSRRAYMASRPQWQYGEDEHGIYTRVRFGPVEVFLLDLRWFAGLEGHPEGGRSLLGSRQRAWLEAGLRASDAPFKLLCGGMVWRDKGGRSQDDWATYAAERDALFAFLGAERITGCVLLGGDVHACQHAVYENTGALYPLHEFVISPLHERAWRGGDRHHAGRRWGTVQPHAFLRIDADTTRVPATLTATWMHAKGAVLHTVVLSATDLVPDVR